MQDFEENETETVSSPRRVGAILAVVVTVAVALFSLGVMVGKKANRPLPPSGEPPAALPTETLIPLSPEELPSRSGEEPRKAAGRDEPVASERLTFFDRLSGDKAGEPALPKAPPAADESPVATAAVKPATAVPAASPEEKKPAPATVKKKPPTPAEKFASLSQGGRWSVQVSSGTNSDWSDDYIRKLGKKGLDARSVHVMLDGKRWYRIWVGQFPDRDTAKKARQVLESGFNLKGNVVQGD